MSFAGYNDLLIAMGRMIDGDDAGYGDLPVASLEQFLMIAEHRIYREVRSRHNEKAFSALTVSSNLATIPSDFEATSVIHFGGKPLEPVSEEWLREYLDSGPTGDCTYFAEAGSSFLFGPSVADGTTVQGRYFYRYPALTRSNFGDNTLISKEPDLFLYAALLEGAPYMGGDQMAKVPLWAARYEAIRDRLNADKNRAAFSAGRIRVRPSTRLLG